MLASLASHPVFITVAAMVLALCLSLALGRAARALQQRLLASAEGFSAPSSAQRRTSAHFLPIAAMGFAGASIWAFGATFAAPAAILFTVMLLVLARVDAETGLLPDLLTQPLLWLGLLVNLNGTFASLHDAVLGAVGGYLILWSVYQGFLLLTGREGLGHGDFKLLAALGAWLGWTALPWVLLVASSLGLVAALCLRATGRMAAGDTLSFGPWLAAAGIIVLFGSTG